LDFENIIEEIEKELEKLKENKLNDNANDLIQKIIKKCENSGKIFVYGAGRSGYIGRAFVMRLVQTGFDAYFLGESSTPLMHEKDILILISGSGKTEVVEKVISISKKNNLEIVMITSDPRNKIRNVDQLIGIEGKTKTETEISSLPLGSLFEINAFIFLDCLITKIIEESPKARQNIEKVARKYRKNGILVF